MATSSAWRPLMEGSGTGILALTGRRATATFTGDGLSTTVGELEWSAAMGS